jgi:hypothetical protein
MPIPDYQTTVVESVSFGQRLQKEYQSKARPPVTSRSSKTRGCVLVC